jgi:hypothetical protein
LAWEARVLISGMGLNVWGSRRPGPMKIHGALF